MCIEDIRMGRESAAAAKIVAALANTLTPLVGPDPMRTRLIFSGDGINVTYVVPQGIVPGNNAGFALSLETPLQTFRVEDWGKLVTGPWSGICRSVDTNITVAEVSLEKQ